MIDVVLIEDNLGDARLIQEMLREVEDEAFVITHVQRLSDGLDVMWQSRPDVILLDLALPDSVGLETLQAVRERVPGVPVVILTGLDDQDMGVQAVQQGAQDYLAKGYVHGRLLEQVILYAIERKRIEDERERLIADLNAFAHTVAHDLKSPLQFVVGASELLQTHWDKVKTREVQEWLDQIYDQSNKMGAIIDDLLLLARVRADEVPLEALPMAEIVTSAWQRLSPLIEQYGAEIIMPEEWPVAKGYSPWVEQVWFNYLSNAVKYGGEPPRIRLGAVSGSDNMVKFWICNNGPPIPPDLEAQLFQPFSRLNQMQREGHGLGLSIVRRIVEKLGGEVGLEKRGQQSCFTFTLPALDEGDTLAVAAGETFSGQQSSEN
jgi:signal transduction histidine kinase